VSLAAHLGRVTRGQWERRAGDLAGHYRRGLLGRGR